MGLKLKIIFSPSKEMRDENILNDFRDFQNITFKENSIKILKKLKSFSRDELSLIMKIKGNILENALNNIQNFDNLEEIPALSLYNGVAFKELNIETYSQKQLEYIENKLYILSAFYGLSKAFSLIKKYRLDMTMKIFEFSLYEFWKEELNSFIEAELKSDKNPYLINLASGEFSKMIDRKRIGNIINIDFKEYKNGVYTSVSSYSKQARGKFLNLMIKKQIEDIELLKEISFSDYKLNMDLSDENNFIFSRK